MKLEHAAEEGSPEMAKQKWEHDAKERLLQFLRDNVGEAWTVLREDVVVDASTNRNFDYELGLNERRIALELFRLVADEDELARWRVWGEVVHALEAELARRSLRGYLLTTPSYFMVPRVKRDGFVRQLADKIEILIKSNSGLDEISFDGFSLKRIENLQKIACSAFGKGGAVDPPGIALAALEEKLPNKNAQLAIADHDKVLMVVNWSHLVGVGDMLEAASRIDFGRFPNVDKIFFEESPGNFQQVFDRKLFNGFESGKYVPDPELEPLFVQWLECHLARKERRAFEIVKELSAHRGGVLWLPPMSRAEIVRYGTGFVKADDWDNVNWILSNFKNDPDPSTENDARDFDGEFNLHRRVERGENVRFILTVRGHLCWLLHEVIRRSKPELYEELFTMVEQFAIDPHLYLRQQATIPLTELAKRRWSPSGQSAMPESLGDRVRALTLRMLRDNAGCPPVLEGVASVMNCTTDWSPAEAEEALTLFLKNPTDEASRLLSHLLLFYGVYRERETAKMGPFDSTRISKLLRQQLIDGAPAMRSSILWRMSHTLEKPCEEANILLPYVAAFTSGAYDRNAFFHFYKIALAQVKSHPDLVGPALKNALYSQKKFLSSNEDERVWDFDDQQWPALKFFFDSGRANEFLDCIEIAVEHRKQIFAFPTALIRACLGQIRTERATQILNRMDLT